VILPCRAPIPFASSPFFAALLSLFFNSPFLRNGAKGEEITRVQIIALILHFLARDVRRPWPTGRWPGRKAAGQASNNKICTGTHASRAEFSRDAVLAGGSAFWRVFLPNLLG
jgi:hypothetical protein